MLDRHRGRAVLLEPGGRREVQVDDRVGFDAPELPEQELPEQGVIAEPLATPIERNQEDVGCLELAQHVLRVDAVEHGVAERRGERVEHGRAAQESLLVLGELGERLPVEVVGHVAVVAGHRQRVVAAVACDGCGEEQADGPPFGALDDLGRVVGAERDLRLGEDLAGAGGIDREVDRGDLEGVSRRAEAGQVRLLAPARRHHLGTARDPGEHHAQHVVARGGADLVEVVEHEDEGRGAGPECGGQQGRRAPQRGDAVSADVDGEVVHARRDAGVGRRQEGEQRCGVVVEAIERRPRDRTLLRVGPLGQEGRLAVPRRCRHAHHTAPAGTRRGDQGGAGDRATGRGLRD